MCLRVTTLGTAPKNDLIRGGKAFESSIAERQNHGSFPRIGKDGGALWGHLNNCPGKDYGSRRQLTQSVQGQARSQLHHRTGLGRTVSLFPHVVNLLGPRCLLLLSGRLTVYLWPCLQSPKSAINSSKQHTQILSRACIFCIPARSVL